jgi:cellulose biosynthesis protein BcsQ
MIISIYGTKGGVGKTTTLISLLSDFAHFNKKNPDKVKTVLALDSDPQGTLTEFGEARERRGREAYGIDFEHYKEGDHLAAYLNEKRNEYDFILIDAPRTHISDRLSGILTSDIIVTPSSLRAVEMYEAIVNANQINTLINDHGLSATHALLLVREPQLKNMTGKVGKAIFETTYKAGYDILDARLTHQQAYANLTDYNVYAFELDEVSKGKSNHLALEEAKQTTQSLLTQTILDRDMDPEDAFWALGTRKKPTKKTGKTQMSVFIYDDHLEFIRNYAAEHDISVGAGLRYFLKLGIQLAKDKGEE